MLAIFENRREVVLTGKLTQQEIIDLLSVVSSSTVLNLADDLTKETLIFVFDCYKVLEKNNSAPLRVVILLVKS